MRIFADTARRVLAAAESSGGAHGEQRAAAARIGAPERVFFLDSMALTKLRTLLTSVEQSANHVPSRGSTC